MSNTVDYNHHHRHHHHIYRFIIIDTEIPTCSRSLGTQKNHTLIIMCHVSLTNTHTFVLLFSWGPSTGIIANAAIEYYATKTHTHTPTPSTFDLCGSPAFTHLKGKLAVDVVWSPDWSNLKAEERKAAQDNFFFVVWMAWKNKPKRLELEKTLLKKTNKKNAKIQSNPQQNKERC